MPVFRPKHMQKVSPERETKLMAYRPSGRMVRRVQRDTLGECEYCGDEYEIFSLRFDRAGFRYCQECAGEAQ